jgi:hypothetical protein
VAGLKLIGFAIWERSGGVGRNVKFPARQYWSTASDGASHCCGRFADVTRKSASAI